MTVERFNTITGFSDSLATRITKRHPALEGGLVFLASIGRALEAASLGSKARESWIGVLEEVTREHGPVPGAKVGLLLFPSGERRAGMARVDAATYDYRLRRTA